MFSHVTVGVGSLERALAFYEPLMAELGLVSRFRETHWAGWMQPGLDRPLFIVTRPHDGQPATSGNGQMVAFVAATRGSVDRFHELAMRQGGVSEGLPEVRPQYHASYYGAYVRDLDGNKLCACCHEPDPEGNQSARAGGADPPVRATGEGTD